jgi:nicotinate-nucleotide pyrophosphorylase (carboxylating)
MTAVDPLAPAVVDEAVAAALAEDGADDDATTHAVIEPQWWARGVIVARDAGVIAGLPVAAAAMTALDPAVSFDTLVEDGSFVQPNAELAEVEGRAAVILASERVALNFLQRLSGIATMTRDYVDAVSGTGARILDTRKTTPGMRPLERYAVRAGGGHNHRYNLSTGILIKDNHIAIARQQGDVHLGAVIMKARRSAAHTMRIEVEVTNLDEVDEAVEGKADIVLLDNMTPDDVRRAVERIAGRALVEASGGITLENVRAYAEAGVDYISVGRLTHAAPALDMGLEVTAV